MGVSLDQPDRIVGPGARSVVNGDPGLLAQRAEYTGCDRPRSLCGSRPPVGAAINVNKVASGRQQNRSGANGEVPIPAETCNRMVAPQRDCPLARDRSRPELVTNAP